MSSRLSLDTLNRADPAEFARLLGGVFEHSPWVAEAVAPRRPFATLAALYAALADAARAAPADRQMALLRAHPDLAGKAARAGAVTDFSKAEQASAGLTHLTDAEFARFETLNADYRAKFGIPFIVCVRRHSKDSILAQFARRLAHAPAQERDAALAEVLLIARLRLAALVEAPDALPVAGRLSTHVLDTMRGRPAAGLAIELAQLSVAGERLPLKAVTTNADGRTDAPLIAGQPLPIGTYELSFHVGRYFATAGVALAEPAFLDIVPIRFAIAEPEGHYHVPLLVTPWSYQTYRGS